jgi:hypothetical protein
MALGTMPSDITALALVKVLQDERYFYRVRMEAAISLSQVRMYTTNHPFSSLIMSDCHYSVGSIILKVLVLLS